ncbi:PREDICTED: uncharacterized protein LOC108370960 [Rhagoletis zephyria]|uniref:uncharacterized protein LOC108370960 n=1 Tax=Rhagoletis zephyria TaxID=28612 RepID=UPI000811A0B5|nr:PREDICTED: uncharacterized protein LOC108370960 [Rhagoletis zephyria]
MAPSFIWFHCSKIDNGKKVKCNLCGKEFLFNKSTSNMLKHLQRIHKIDPSLNKEKQPHKRGSDTNNNSDIQSKKGPTDRCINNASSFSGGGYRHEQITTALLRMIAVDNMPLCTPERPGFKMFVNKLQPLFISHTV